MTLASLSRYDPIKGCFVLKDLNPLPPANAFEWQRYVVEESVRRGDKQAPDVNNTSRKRSIASTKAIERIRETEPTYGTVGISAKTSKMIELKPKDFNIYSRAQTRSKGRGDR
jgi:hypothetical protein